MARFLVTTFYKFLDIEQAALEAHRGELLGIGEKLGISGLILIATEGINGTIAGKDDAVAEFREVLQAIVGELLFKDSRADSQPFKRFKVKVKDEIVAIGKPELSPRGTNESHLPPRDWHDLIESEEDVVLLDTRNIYETDVGTFQGAIDPRIDKFNQFPDFVREAGIPKEKKVLMYCTGGIRCEKAILEMQNQGYKNVFQLEGGILKYLEEYPKGHFDGECFVFDHRVSVNQNLEASRHYDLCPHCGDPGKEKIICGNCAKEGIVCADCLALERNRTCSKNCRYHYDLQLSTS